MVLINGHTRTSSDFRSFAALLNRKGYSVLCGDNRGSGKSETDSAFSLTDLAEDVQKLIATFTAPPVHVVGFSLGGAVALTLAAAHPNDVKSIALVSSTATWEDKLPDATAPDFHESLPRYFSPTFFKAQQNFILHFAKDLKKRAEDPKVKQGAKWQRAAVQGLDLKPIAKIVEAPALILHGDEDKVVPFKRAAELKGLVANAELFPLKGIGHLPLVECPNLLYDKIADFIGRVDNNSAP